MKKFYIFTLIGFSSLLFSTKANAQETDPLNDVSGAVTVKINLNDVISIAVANPEVIFNYTTKDHYFVEQVVSKEGHLTVVSNQAYDIQVSGVSAPDDFPLDIVGVTVDGSTLNGGAATSAYLGADAHAILTGGTASTEAVFKVNYSISAEKATDVLFEEGEKAYSTTITYTATHL